MVSDLHKQIEEIKKALQSNGNVLSIHFSFFFTKTKQNKQTNKHKHKKPKNINIKT